MEATHTHTHKTNKQTKKKNKTQYEPEFLGKPSQMR